MNRTSLVFALVLAASACAPDPSQYTVEYYKHHKEEREKRLSECANDPGSLRNEPTCINAQRAGADASWGSLRDLKPIGLLDDDSSKAKGKAGAVDPSEK